jgi:arsenate reductase (glutaredoxin)
MVTVYGIPNCDTVKRARQWLQDNGVAYAFHDFKKMGVPADQLALWLQALGSDRLLNRKGTTWRKLDPTVESMASTNEGALSLAQAQPSVIKRPVVDWGDSAAQRWTVGFDAGLWKALSTEITPAR